MKTRFIYQKDIKLQNEWLGSRYKLKNECFSIVEIEPHLRTLFINKNYVRVSLPYLYTFWKYYITARNQFVYPGIYNQGLAVYGSHSEFSLQSKCFILPFENNYKGICCTDHKLDNTVYESFQSLFDTIIGSWFNTSHIMSVNWFNKKPVSFDLLKDIENPLELIKSTHFPYNQTGLYFPYRFNELQVKRNLYFLDIEKL